MIIKPTPLEMAWSHGLGSGLKAKALGQSVAPGHLAPQISGSRTPVHPACASQYFAIIPFDVPLQYSVNGA